MRNGWIFAALAFTAFCPVSAQAADAQNFDQIQQGHYLATLGDCEACHNDPKTGQVYAGGRATETPFGTVLGANITPDQATGIGAWTDDEFVDALQKGLGRGGVHLYPAMPYPYFTKISRDDALAIRAYLATIPAVNHPVEANQLPLPFSIRTDMAAWNKLFFHEGRFEPDKGKSESWNRGAYLVEGLEHCGVCHTPKNAAGGDEIANAYHGATLQGWWNPDLTGNSRGGLGAWAADDIVRYLKTGHNRFAAASGPMAEEVELSSSKLNDADLSAIATYLKDLPGTAAERKALQPLATDDPVMKAGAAIYADECSACHKPDGQGVPMLFPDLRHIGAVEGDSAASLLRVVIRGAQSAASTKEPTGPAMPAFGWQLSDDQIASLVTYVRNGFGNAAPAVSASDVAKVRADLEKRSD